jgi:hypothetical protein
LEEIMEINYSSEDVLTDVVVELLDELLVNLEDGKTSLYAWAMSREDVIASARDKIKNMMFFEVEIEDDELEDDELPEECF